MCIYIACKDLHASKGRRHHICAPIQPIQPIQDGME